MKKLNDMQTAVNKGNQVTNSWLVLLQWLRLLVLSLTRIKLFIAGNIVQRPALNHQNQVLLKSTKTEQVKIKKLTSMKPTNRYIKWSVMLLFVVCAEFATAQVSPGPYPFSGDDNVCLNQTKSYGVVDVPTSTYTWTITPGVAGTDWILTPTGHNTITVQWLKVGTYTLTVTETNSNGCPSNPVSINITVNPLLTSTQNITVCANQLPYTWLGHVFTGAATITDTVAGNNSCDTIRTLTLAVNPLLTSTQNITICANQLPYTWLGHVFNGAATITDTVAGNNSCDTIRTLIVNVNPVPVPVVIGPSPVCESINSNVGTYTVPPVAGVTYFWTVSSNGTIVSGQGTNSITVQWNTAGPGTVQVTEADTSTGCTGTNVLPVTVTPKPITTPITHN